MSLRRRKSKGWNFKSKNTVTTTFINPLTKRKVTLGGTVHLRLINKGIVDQKGTASGVTKEILIKNKKEMHVSKSKKKTPELNLIKNKKKKYVPKSKKKTPTTEQPLEDSIKKSHGDQLKTAIKQLIKDVTLRDMKSTAVINYLIDISLAYMKKITPIGKVDNKTVLAAVRKAMGVGIYKYFHPRETEIPRYPPIVVISFFNYHRVTLSSLDVDFIALSVDHVLAEIIEVANNKSKDRQDDEEEKQFTINDIKEAIQEDPELKVMNLI